MTDSPPLDQAFRLAASELGMASAAWMFVEEAAVSGGDAAVDDLREALGRSWPILDAVCAGWLDGARTPAVRCDEVSPLLLGASRLVIVGLETHWIDPLLNVLPPTIRVALVQASALDPDWLRVAANFGGRVTLLDLADFQTWAGPRSVLLTFVYGESARQAFVLPSWLRVCGPDVRMQFRDLAGWSILNLPLAVYPRWLVAEDIDSFTALRPEPS